MEDTENCTCGDLKFHPPSTQTSNGEEKKCVKCGERIFGTLEKMVGYCDSCSHPTQTSEENKEHHTYCKKCGRTSNTVDMFNSCPFCTRSLSTVLEEQRREFDRRMTRAATTGGNQEDDRAWFFSTSRTVIEKVLNQLDSLESGIDMGLFKDSGKLVIKHLQKILQESIKG